VLFIFIAKFAKRQFLDIHIVAYHTTFVATLALGSRPRQMGYKGAGQEEAQELKQEKARESRQRGCKGAGQEEAQDKKKPGSHITYSREC